MSGYSCSPAAFPPPFRLKRLLAQRQPRYQPFSQCHRLCRVHCRSLRRGMSWNENDPVDLEATLEAALDDGGVAAEPSADDAGEIAADAEADAEGSQAAAAADAEAAAEDAPNDAPSSAPGPPTDVEPDAGEPHGGGEDGAQQSGAGEGDDNCAICQVSLREDPDDSLADSGPREVALAILPCLHKFHKCCIDQTCRVLSQPVSTLECPTCRKTPQDIRAMEERMISDGLARRVAEARQLQIDRLGHARQLQIDEVFGGAAAALAAAIPKAHGQRCAGLINL